MIRPPSASGGSTLSAWTGTRTSTTYSPLSSPVTKEGILVEKIYYDGMRSIGSLPEWDDLGNSMCTYDVAGF